MKRFLLRLLWRDLVIAWEEGADAWVAYASDAKRLSTRDYPPNPYQRNGRISNARIAASRLSQDAGTTASGEPR